MISLVWLRRDLRLHDHAALATALAEPHPVQPIFIFDSEILARFSNKHDRRLSFIAETLCHIDAQLKKRGGGLLVFHGKPIEIIPKLAEMLAAGSIYSAKDFEPATRARDADVRAALPATNRFVQLLDHLMLAPQTMVKADKTPYKIFTPYYKIWRSRIGPETLVEYTVKDKGRYADFTATAKAAEKAGLMRICLEEGPEKTLVQIGYAYKKDELWRVDDVRERLSDFIANRLQVYPTARDQLPILGTSQLSPYLRHGLISIRECMRAVLDVGHGEKWISELGWREFYAAILYHFPEVETQEFAPQYRGTIPWSYDPKLIDAFQQARTGYPIIDAAVRELLETGSMHNRARMIVASFVTKDLLLDWRIGEEFFAQHLMDYELASNNGGWQWAASTGTDASPYFRVFNPELQSRKFDPKAAYIRRFLPELADMPNRDIHAPAESLLKPKSYPLPIVDHSAARERVIALFKRVGRGRD